jgi:DNA-binding NarL/FixJ family response regulator
LTLPRNGSTGDEEMTPLDAMIFVYERRPRREAELKRRFAGETISVRPCRSAGDLLALCRSAPGSVAVIDLSVGAATVLHCLEQVLRERLNVFPLVVAAADPGDLEWPLRELGAHAVYPESVSGDELARMCRRFRGAATCLSGTASASG